MIKKLLLITLAVALVNCASQGNKKLGETSNTELNSKLVKNVTSKDEVKSILGEPSDITYNHHENEVWTYEFTHMQMKAENFIPFVNMFAGGTNDTKKKLIIIFNDNDTIKKYTSTHSSGETGLYASSITPK